METSHYTLIPYDKISAHALDQIMHEYIGREGTDYGAVELDLEVKKTRLKKQILSGDVLIVFDTESESVTLLTAQQFSDHINDQ